MPAQHPPATIRSERILRFQADSRERAANPPASPRAMNMDTAFFGRYARKPFWARYARSLAFTLQQEPVYLFPDEHLVGMTCQIHKVAEVNPAMAER